MYSETPASGARSSPSSNVPMPRLVCCLVALACLVGACAPVHHYNRLQVAEYTKLPRKPYHTVKVFQTADDVKRQYEVVGMMSCEGSAGEEAGILNAMLYRAADMGADAIILNVPRVGAEDVSAVRVNVKVDGWAALTGSGNQRAYRAQAIRFKD